MGWTGMFNWDSCEKNWQILNHEFFGSSENRFEPLKWSQRGSHVWLLAKHKETGSVFCSVILCSRDKKNHEFLYKEIDLSCGPCETDMPYSWLKLIDKRYFEENYSKEWLERFVKEHDEQKSKKNSLKFQVGDIIKCTAPYTITWGSYKVEKDEVFYVKYRDYQRYPGSKKTKIYQLVRKTDNGFSDMFYRIKGTTFKICKVEKVA